MKKKKREIFPEIFFLDPIDFEGRAET